MKSMMYGQSTSKIGWDGATSQPIFCVIQTAASNEIKYTNK
jgi:hypothetical protein